MVPATRLIIGHFGDGKINLNFVEFVTRFNTSDITLVKQCQVNFKLRIVTIERRRARFMGRLTSLIYVKKVKSIPSHVADRAALISRFCGHQPGTSRSCKTVDTMPACRTACLFPPPAYAKLFCLVTEAICVNSLHSAAAEIDSQQI